MIVRQYAPCSLGRSIICLGKQGEINALRVEFDVSAWMAMYPDATVKLMHFAPDRPQDNPVIPTLGVEGTLRVWIVGEEDTAGAGNGVIELLLIDERTGSTIKSATGYTTVLRSPSAGIEAQEAEAGYVRYDIDQSALLTDEQKAVARKNIGAGTGDDTGSGGILKETDPTVPDWAKQPSKPTYTAGEVGARPDSWTPSASDVGADAAGTASGAVAAHNTSGAAHADLRALIEGLTSRLNALADSDDTTLDQLSEIVAYIKNNKALIDAVTTGKVSVSDIVDNLTTNASGKVLSAAQGVALKAMIDGIVIPTALPNPQPITINGQRYDGSEEVTLTVNSEGGGTPVEIDDTLTQSGKAADAKVVGDQLSALNQAKAAQDEEIAKRAKDADLAAVAKSGSYDDLTGKPTIPEAYTLPTASASVLGGVKPVAKTDEMTQSVGVDAQGVLWALPGGGVKRAWRNVAKVDFAEYLNNGVNSFSFDVNDADCIQLSCYGPKNDHESTDSGLNVMFETTGGYNYSVGHYSLIKTIHKSGSIYYYHTVTTFDGGKAFVIKGSNSTNPENIMESGAAIMYRVTQPVSGYVKRIHSSWSNTDGSFSKLIDGYIDIWAREVVE